MGWKIKHRDARHISKPHQPIILTVGWILLRKRWLVFFIGASIVVIIETIEHWPLLLTPDRHFLTEVFNYGIIGPLVIWLLLSMLDRALRKDLPLDRIQAEATRSERQRIARDLHDNLAQNLGYLHLKLDQLSAAGEATLSEIESIQAELEQMRQLANQAYEEVRGTLNSMWAGTKIPDDIAVALQQEADKVFNRFGIDIKVDHQNDSNVICPIAKRTIVDITREALNNVEKHAGASQVTINLTTKKADTILTIVDNGNGFQYDGKQAVEGHYGLKIMSERMNEMGGVLQIDSAFDRGTQLIAQFPNTVIGKPLLAQCARLQCKHLQSCRDANTSC